MAVASTAQAVLDIEGIVITSCKDYLDETPEADPWNFEIWVDFAATGDLHHIDVNLPDGGLPDFTIPEDFGYWEYESPAHYLTLAALQGDYPTGDYAFEFLDSNNMLLNSVTLDYSGIDEPSGPVHFMYPDDGAMDVPLDPTYEWDVGINDGNALGMWVLDPTDDDVYGDVPVSMGITLWQPGVLDPNHTYELEVSVFNVKDGQPGPSLPTKDMDIGGDTFVYGLLIEHINMIEFTTVPEPATVGLLGFGSLALLCTPGKRKKM